MVTVNPSVSSIVLANVQAHKTTIITTVFVILLLFPVTPSGKDDLVRNTDKGRVRGIRYYLPKFGKAVDAFLGIPFAKPPVKHLRFQHPEPIEQWSGVRNATKLPNSCYQQPDKFFEGFYGAEVWNPTTRVSEDCLYINVWVPRTHPKLRKAAVMVWIFGGGFYSGTPTLNLYDGKILAALNEVIVVSIGYRVGALGFLSLGHPTIPGNAGMYDQLMGLEWVQTNIRDFGGDPDNVTLFGESAGSVSVSLHLLSPLSRNKFNRAIMQSGTANTAWATMTVKEAKRRALDLASVLGCEDSDDMEVIARCLRLKGPQQITEEQWVSRGVLQFPFVPVVDGIFLRENPLTSLKRKNFKKCPILLGSNANEGSWFIIYELDDYISLDKKSVNRHEFVTSMNILFEYYPQYPQFNNHFGRNATIFQYSNALDLDDTDLNLQSLDAATGDNHFVCPINEFAEAYSVAGENVYSYFLTQRYSTNPWPSWMGVVHGDDIFFVFGELLKDNMNYTAIEQEFAKKMMLYWTNFAKHGDPNIVGGSHQLGEWPLHTPKGKEYLELNARYLHDPDKTKAVGRGPRAKDCKFWREYLPALVDGTADITEQEVKWKHEFKEWSTQYIVDWKLQYERFLRNQKQCPNDDN